MTNLTEKYKAGELEEGWYWVSDEYSKGYWLDYCTGFSWEKDSDKEAGFKILSIVATPDQLQEAKELLNELLNTVETCHDCLHTTGGGNEKVNRLKAILWGGLK
jgi:hypothetical protein